MRPIDRTTWECTACGEQVQIEPQQPSRRPMAMVITVSGKPRQRIVTMGDAIVHRCTLGVDYSEDDTQRSSFS